MSIFIESHFGISSSKEYKYAEFKRQQSNKMFIYNLCTKLHIIFAIFKIAFAEVPSKNCPGNKNGIYICNDAKLTAFPPNISADVTKMYLMRNLIKQIPADDYFKDLTELTDLYLNGNIFKSVPQFKIPSLIRLHLERNQIEGSLSIPKSFVSNTNLEFLDLSANKISGLTNDSFKNLKSSGTLSLSLGANPIKSVEILSFAPIATFLMSLSFKKAPLNDNILGGIMKALGSVQGSNNKLKNLILNNVGIFKLNANVFVPLNGKFPITTLDLSSNQFGDIADNAFEPIKKYLSTITIKDSKLTDLHANMFSNLDKLKMVNLDDSADLIAIKDVDTFKGSISINSLTFRKSGLKTWEGKAFSSLAKLKILDLSNNKIQSLSLSESNSTNSFFDLNRTVKSKVSVDLSGNPFLCTCDGVGNFLNDYVGKAKNFNLEKISDYKCDSPSSENGKNILNYNYTACASKNKTSSTTMATQSSSLTSKTPKNIKSPRVILITIILASVFGFTLLVVLSVILYRKCFRLRFFRKNRLNMEFEHLISN